MSAALPSEFRSRFREYLEEGLSGRAAAARLRLSAATGVRWQRKWRETGSVAPGAQGRPLGQGKLAAHQVFLEELVAQEGDITLPELSGALEAVDLSRFRAAPSARLSHFPFERDRAFPSQG
ncbi:hypothetical protein SAMN05444414_111118 [Roseovarius marisflavi]|uniref:Transposase n=1 Tax=Roseovarius marisflavi TaxID=1054996 RepID=A0A1M6ZYN1_9RHOB|nr:transposase [Roseovarius marisflavi]SHL35534.1 hypothetical protein SAMN05444414_111118 [Roseovarius marisflavi]